MTRNNSFDLIRHIAALMVLVSHHFVLSGYAEPSFQGVNSLGGLAVLAFFSISGFLITQSFMRSSLKSYAIKRIARIFPALIVCAFLMVFVLGAFFSPASFLSLTGIGEALLKFLQIAAFGRANVDTVTQGFIFQESLNGSLWTLKLEFGCYVLVALALSMVRGQIMPLLALALFCALNIVAGSIAHPMADKALIYTTVCIGFFVGSSLAFHPKLLASTRSSAAVASAGVALLALAIMGILPSVLSSIGFSLIVLALGTMVNERLIRGRFDISYGLYLYAFPVQQIVINCTPLGFYSSMAVAALVTAILATMSWVLVERPALNYARDSKRSPTALASA